MNLWRLHPVSFPDLSPFEETFDGLIEQTPEGGTVAYSADAPRWWSLHHLIRRGFRRGESVRRVAFRNALRPR